MFCEERKQSMIRGNRGEWSEMYVFLRLLADGKVYAADQHLNKLEGVYYPIVKVIREETGGHINEYTTGEYIIISIDGNEPYCIERERFEIEADNLLHEIQSSSGTGLSFQRTEEFMQSINCFKISAPALNKSDITVKIHDINTGYSPTVGFSIKSELGTKPTLLNAGQTTNFIYSIAQANAVLLSDTNDMYRVSNGKRHIDLRRRISSITDSGASLTYSDMQSITFKDNLTMIDSCLDRIIAETILYYYRDGISKCSELVSKLQTENPMNYGNVNAYSYKFKKFLTSIALGMKPATVWDGIDEATGGFIVVLRDGDVLAYHIYNRNYFEDYLLNNTKYDTASTTRHGFGEIFNEGDKSLLKLNLQIRFT